VGYETLQVTHDTIAPNGKQYYVVDGEPFRIDSLTGKVYHLFGTRMSWNCPDALEREYLNVTVDTVVYYRTCQNETWWVDATSQTEKVGLLSLMRYQRHWSLPPIIHRRFAEEIGLCWWKTISYNPGGDIFRELIFARIDTMVYRPVEFRILEAVILPGNAVLLRWITENEKQNAGFQIQRRPQRARDAPWENIAFVSSKVPEGRGGEYSYIDNSVSASHSGERIEYRLKQLDYDGTTMYSPTVAVELIAVASSPIISAWPNPAHSKLKIDVKSSWKESSVLIITDMLGREVQRLSGMSTSRLVEWNLTGANGIRVSPGMYHILFTNGDAMTGKIVLVQ